MSTCISYTNNLKEAGFLYFCSLTNVCSFMIAAPVMPTKKKFSGLEFPASVKVHYQLSPATLVEQTVMRGQGVLNDTGALCINTGEFTGRSPKDKFIVKDPITAHSVDWNSFNLPI